MKISSVRLDRNWYLVFAIYFIIQILLRTSLGGGLGLDEAEMLLTAQNLEWGYGPQPPLYSWIQHAIFALLGETIFALALVKNAFLCLTYSAMYRLLRCHYTKEIAGLTTLSLALLTQIAWESQRALSHTVLATAMSAITFLIFWQLNKSRSSWLYLLFGACIALGILSKFNYVFLPLAMLGAAISLPATRGTVLNPRILLSFGIAGAILAMPVRWMLTQPDKVLASTHKFKITQESSGLHTALQGTLDLAQASISFAAILIAIFALLYWRHGIKTTQPPDESPLFRLMVRTVVAALLLTLLAVLGTGATNVKGRWLQPILVFAGPVLALWLLPKLSLFGRQRFVQSVIFAAALVCIVLATPYSFAKAGKPSRRSAPFPAVIAAVADKYPDTHTVFTQNNWLGGNVLYLRKNWQVKCPEIQSDRLTGKVVLIWPSAKPEIPQGMLRTLANQNQQIVTVEPATTIKIAYPPGSTAVFVASFTSALIK